MTGNQKTSLTEGNPYIAANGHDPESLAVEGGSRTAFYNHASEKSLSHAEAKMIYRRHVLESAEQDESRPLKRVQTYSSIEKGNPNLGISYGRSISLRRSPVSSRSAQHPDSDTHFSKTDLDNSYMASDSGSDMDHSEIGTDIRADLVDEDAEDSTLRHCADISPELQTISSNIKRVLHLRYDFLKLSRQTSEDNPRDWDGWNIYPPPPNPTWNDDKRRSGGHAPGELRERSLQHSTKVRKPGHDVGDDFDMRDLEPFPTTDPDVTFKLDGTSIFQIYEFEGSEDRAPLILVPSLREYYKALDEIQGVSSDGPTKSFAYRQLDILEGKFQLHHLVNSYQETADCKTVPHRDFYNVRKVDTHVHHSACMNQKHLLRFIKSKMKKCPNEVVMFRDGSQMTLQQVFDSIQLTAYDLSIDTLDMHAHTDSFHRFDKFNLKYNPIGESRLREIFLKTDNYIKGRYLAELTKEVISDLEASKYQFVEWRISIYGRSIDEWDKLAAWVVDNKLISHNVRWLIQVPRLYSMYKATHIMETFETILVNLFEPLYRVTKDPSSNPKLHIFLQRVVGFDSVDDESKAETRLYRRYPPPREWNTKQNPPYTYWIYHLFANMSSLNAWRQRRGINTFVLRPHCGEAGDTDHLAAAVLCCHSISHGLILRKTPLLQYIFYLDQIGIAMSPLSNNALFLSYDRNPFPKYFRRGLNVSLSTDDPLQFAFTKEPLIEEYSVAAQIYRLNAVDMCELAQHSVFQSGFEHELKQRWLGEHYQLPGVQGNSVAKSNVPNLREHFRYKTLMEEREMLDRYAPDLPLITTRTAPSNSSLPASPGLNKKAPSTQYYAATVSGLPDLKEEEHGHLVKDGQKGGITRTTSLIMSPARMRSGPSTSYSPALPQTRIFPGIVNDRHRRISMRQGSGSETDGDSMTSSWKSGDQKTNQPLEHPNGSFQGALLEEAAEDS